MLKFIKKNKFITLSAIASIVLIAVIISFYSVDSKQNYEIVEYITKLGWKIEPRPVEISYLTIPKTFDLVYETYNELQKDSGFDLSAYKEAHVVRYSYRVLNHKNSSKEQVRANIIIFENKIIAADISSNSAIGFVIAINNISGQTQ